MRILFNYYSGGGGGFSNILELLKSFAREYPDTRLFVINTGKLDFSAISDARNVEMVYVDSHQGEWSRLKHGLWGLRRIADEVGADVIWSMNLGTYIKGRIPQVLSINNAYQVYPLKVLRYHPGGFLRGLLLRFFSWRSIRASSGLIFQTENMRQLGRQQAARDVPAIVVAKSVDYGMAHHSINSDEKNGGHGSYALDGRFKYLYVASMFSHKNHDVLLDAMELLRNRGSEITLVLTVGASSLIAKYGSLAERLINEGFVSPIGWVGKDQLRRTYESCNACVMPSVLESLSSAHLEAMAWSRPQIVADMPFARSLCQDAAMYLDPHNAFDWANAMEMLSGDRELSAKLVAAGRAVSSKFSSDWRSIAGSIFAFLRENVDTPIREGN